MNTKQRTSIGMDKKFWIILALLVAGFVGIIWLGGNKNTDGLTDTPATKIIKHSTGKQDAPVVLVEYSDFQCSACKAYYPIVEQVVEKYKNQISFEYRHYPLTSIHRNALAAARSSEAAGNQGKFWEMYRLLFANQSVWAESDSAQTIFKTYAKQLDLNMDQYNTDFASSKTNGAISASIQEFNKRKLPQATPTFLLNGKKIQFRTVEELSKLIDNQLTPSK